MLTRPKPQIIIDCIVSIDGHLFLSGNYDTNEKDGKPEPIRIPVDMATGNRIIMHTVGEFPTYVGHPDVERDAATYME